MKKALTVSRTGCAAALCALPVITLGGAASALYYSLAKCVRRGRERPLAGIFPRLPAELRHRRGPFAHPRAAAGRGLCLRALSGERAAERAGDGSFTPSRSRPHALFALDICALGFPRSRASASGRRRYCPSRCACCAAPPGAPSR